MHFTLSLLLLLFLYLWFFVNGSDDVSLYYIYNFSSTVERMEEKEYRPMIRYVGNVETSAYTLTDGKELMFVNLRINECDGIILNNSILGIIIRQQGLLERMVVNSEAENGLLNLLKGVINLLNLDELRRNGTEADVNGECSVKYSIINEFLLLKEKKNCERNQFYSSITETVDSFSLYQERAINIHYRFDNEGGLSSIHSSEILHLESVLNEELTQTFLSKTSLLFSEIMSSKSYFGSVTVENLIKYKFGKRYKDVFMVTFSEICRNEPIKNEDFLTEYKRIKSFYEIEKKSEIILELSNLFRRIFNQTLLREIFKEKDNDDMVHDSLIGCGSKICFEVIMSELDHCSVKDKVEANRILILMQHVSIPGEYLINALMKRLMNSSSDLYGQLLQTISSLINKLQGLDHMNHVIKSFHIHVKKKLLLLCFDNNCLYIHLIAVKNSKMSIFYKDLMTLLSKSGNYSSTIVTQIFKSLSSLNYDKETRLEVVNSLLQIFKREINFYFNPRVQVEAILSLVQLQCNTEVLVKVLDVIQINDENFYMFLIRKLKLLINLGIIKNSHTLLKSKFFRKQYYYYLTSNALTNIFVYEFINKSNLYSDIHLNFIGKNDGAVRNSLTDIFLVTTASENHLFSFNIDLNEFIEIDESKGKTIQVVLFGKEINPIKEFDEIGQIKSAVWILPNKIESYVSGTYFVFDLYREITFQNGITLVLKYQSLIDFDFSSSLYTNFWNKITDSLLSVTARIYLKMETHMKSLIQNSWKIKSLALKFGLDFKTNTNFSGQFIKNCFSLSKSQSKINFLSVSEESKSPHYSSLLKTYEGSCYAFGKRIDKMCSIFT